MPVITVFSASQCRGDEVAQGVAQRLDLELVDDKLFAVASEQYGFSKESLTNAVFGRSSFLNNITHERERCVAALQLTLAQFVASEEFVYSGFASHLITGDIPHVLKVCLVANLEYRVAAAAKEHGISAAKAKELIQKEDEKCYEWVYYLHKTKPWEPDLYDLVLPMHGREVSEAVDLICEHAGHEALVTNEASRRAAADFLLASEVHRALAAKGYFFRVACDSGDITVTFDKDVLLPNRLAGKLETIALGVPGVKTVKTLAGVSSKVKTPFGAMDLEQPIRVLLVDDERDFVETLSERLRARKLQSSVAYDGEQALAAVEKEAPEVMVLDLKMPGIDGMEVLRRIKKERPAVEVIILTGHGSKEDERLAKELGAFAYLEKPVDISVLTRVMQEANAKIKGSS